MTKVNRWTVTAAVLAAALSGSVLAFQGGKPDPVIGTWTLNVAKSKFEPGPAAKSGTVTFMAAGDGVHVVAEIATPDSTMKTDYTANYDGKDYPIKGMAGADMVSLKRIDAGSSERTEKWAARPSASGHARFPGTGKP